MAQQAPGAAPAAGGPPAQRRAAILAHDRFGPFTSKTAIALIRYGHDRVVAVIDRSKQEADASEYIGGPGEGIPVVPSMADALAHRPQVLYYGIAPEGGGLPDHDRAEVYEALKAGVDVVCGMHVFLEDDPVLAKAARGSGARIWDVRRPPRRRRLVSGDGLFVEPPVVYVSGTDCSTGKMTVAVELAREVRRRGMRAAFVASGQSGMMIGCDAGACIDAIPGDFMAGEVEALVLEAAAKRPDIIFVEGQASLQHPAYGAVALALLEGSFPRAVVMCHHPGRTHFKAFREGERFHPRLPPISKEIALTEQLLEGTTGGRVVAIAVMATEEDPDEEARSEAMLRSRVGLPVADVLKDGPGPLLDAVLAAGGPSPHRRPSA